jgi:hypothetical protein
MSRELPEIAEQEKIPHHYDLHVSCFQDAIVSFRNALQLDLRFPYAISGLCIAHALAKKPGDAVAACLRAAAGEPDSAAAHYFLGIAYMDLGEIEKSTYRPSESCSHRTSHSQNLCWLGLRLSQAEKIRGRTKAF